jgi:transcriptional regulator with XRE-family HTH domain
MNFGSEIRKLRISKGLLIRELAAALKTDSATISKIERGSRNATKDQVLILAKVLEKDLNELMALWLGEKVYGVLKDEEMAKKALRVAERQINYKRKK